MDGHGVRDLLRRATTATLATHDVATGHPYASLVEVATLPDARPVMLLSGLARHTANAIADPRASLLVDQRAEPSPLAAERVALLGTLQRASQPGLAARYLARHPHAKPYSEFSDFGYWVLDISLAHVISGFGRIGKVPGENVVLRDPAVHMNGGREERLLASVNAADVVSRLGVRVIGIDAEGFDFASASTLQRRACDLAGMNDENIIETIACSLSRGAT